MRSHRRSHECEIGSHESAEDNDCSGNNPRPGEQSDRRAKGIAAVQELDRALAPCRAFGGDDQGESPIPAPPQRDRWARLLITPAQDQMGNRTTTDQRAPVISLQRGGSSFAMQGRCQRDRNDRRADDANGAIVKQRPGLLGLHLIEARRFCTAFRDICPTAADRAGRCHPAQRRDRLRHLLPFRTMTRAP